MVYLSIKNIITKRPNHKLENKFLGPYKITKKILENNYQLDLLPKVKIHPIFHILLLKLVINTIKVHIAADDIKVKAE